MGNDVPSGELPSWLRGPVQLSASSSESGTTAGYVRGNGEKRAKTEISGDREAFGEFGSPPRIASKPERMPESGQITPRQAEIGILPLLANSTGQKTLESTTFTTRQISLVSGTGQVILSGDNQEFPTGWSENAATLVFDKYFRHVVDPVTGQRTRERSVRQMISRVASTIAQWGRDLGYFEDPVDVVSPTASVFEEELSYILLHQMASFNSPVWFNVGVEGTVLRSAQASACFILDLDDTMESILDLGTIEGRLYKRGSGSGVNYSKLRSSREKLSGGGYASGPVAFLAKDDANAGAVKSGGATRRAAKIAILNADHGDILDFIKAKSRSEKAAQALVDAGFSGDFRERWGAYQMVPFQNSNHSVRVTDEFMRAVDTGKPWYLLRRDHSLLETLEAQDLWQEICQAAWECGDPGLQFDTTTNLWHTCPVSGRIEGSNPCSEFVFLANSACNLASLNLLKFVNHDGSFDVQEFTHVVGVLITAMEILVDASSYPTEKIQENSSKFRPLGLGYSNLGALLMAQGLPYDSLEGRRMAEEITSLMTACAYAQSARLAAVKGPFAGYETNKQYMHAVVSRHASESRFRLTHNTPIAVAAQDAWKLCRELGEQYGYRNSQVTLLAPCGTISFQMDCDTTGIEPDLSLVKHKKLVGGGSIDIVNQQVPVALRRLGYSDAQIEEIDNYVHEKGSVVGAPHVDEKHYSVFDCSLADPVGGRFIAPRGHLEMMAAVQPFLSGAISKTINMPAAASIADISEVYKSAWRSGLKSVTVYRDGCKRTQPLETKRTATLADAPAEEPADTRQSAVRVKLLNDCVSHRHKFTIGAHEGYLHVGMYPDGSPGEIFIKMAKEGSTVSGLMDAVGVLSSLCLQYGVPLEVLVEKFAYTCFEPSGMTDYEPIRFAKSPLDYVFRWLAAEYLCKKEVTVEQHAEKPVDRPVEKPVGKVLKNLGLVCGRCSNPAQRAGACITCPTCGWTSGCG